MGKRPTIQMVAERAGVSRGTVDRVLNNRSYVKEEIRARVLEAIAEVGYMSPREAHEQTLREDVFAPLRLGVLLPNWTDYFRPEVLRGIASAQEELAKYNVEILMDECRTDIPGEANERLDGLIRQGARGIALCAINDITIEAKTSALVAQGIPVITFNSDLPNSQRICFVGQNYNKSGRIAAELVSKCIRPPERVLAMCGNLEFDGHRRRLTGFCERMHEVGFPSDRIEIIETYNDYHVTYRKVTEMLQHMPQLGAIYMANPSVEGCAQAVEDAKRKGRVRVIVHDLSENTRALLTSGGVDFAISQNFFRQGYLPLKFLRELLQLGKQPEPDQTNTSISVICSQNME
ncbi:MAG: substrate-binding domain-containing protein [Clostridiaceae bacterium]|nr:substrate-binding domain-containing protein [Clostridiaceae bacterium]